MEGPTISEEEHASPHYRHMKIKEAVNSDDEVNTEGDSDNLDQAQILWQVDEGDFRTEPDAIPITATKTLAEYNSRRSCSKKST